MKSYAMRLIVRTTIETLRVSWRRTDAVWQAVLQPWKEYGFK
ncbi:MAG TPA: hypothetical protein VFX54_20245 [Candidatus Binatia bacterium]|nr:hypothetical protein [Candidatus Binatia bacterium]